MDIYYNGIIYLNDEKTTKASAMAAEDGLVKAVGSDEAILAMASSEDSRLDLDGKLVMPGFVDSHLHFVEYAVEKSFVDLSSAGSLEELLSMMRERLPEALEKNKPLRGFSFDNNYWEDPTLPTRDNLDSLSIEIPITVRRTCHHVTVCNTPALRLCGLEQSNPDGILQEDDQYALLNALPRPTVDDIKELILSACYDVASKGITEIQTDDLTLIPIEPYGKTIIDAFRQLSEEGKLTIRVYEQCNLPSMERLKAFLNDGYMTGQSFGNFTIGPLKLLGDGALGARSAALMEPYQDDPENTGILNFRDKELSDLVLKAHKAGMQIAIHGIGDRCIQQILDSFAKALEEDPREDHRHGIVHCQITRPEQLKSMQDMNIMAYIQPVFLKADQYIVEDRIGPELTSSSYDWRTMEDMGIRLAGGSDCPVEPFDILPNMYYALTCREPGAEHAWHPEKSLTLEETIRLFTSDGAYASFSADRRGKTLPGFDADFVVLDRDITTLPAEALLEAQVLMIFVGGKNVYSI